MLNTANGTSPLAGCAITRSTPSTMSSMKVKSRCIWPWLNTLIGSPLRMASVNSHGAMSGRPHGPYTVKKRRPVTGSWYRWA
ncbi:hypothetical protein D3C71_2112800 [compost metagenome]